jgi:ABC-2 type transport system permease protein
MRPSESVRRIGVLIRHNLLLMLGEPGPLLSRMILPLVAAQGGAAGTEQAVVGTLVTFSLLALSISGSAILTERLGRTWDRLRGTALRPAEILVGKAVPVFGALLARYWAVNGLRAALAVGRLRGRSGRLVAL